MIYADLHTHSKYSRATSNKMNIKHLSINGCVKGLNLIGTGDFTHPEWLKEIKENTIHKESGILESKHNDMKFMLTSEIATIYSQNQKVRKIHHIIILPSLEHVEQFNDLLRKKLYKKGKKCNLTHDGRPIIGMTSIELAETVFSVHDKALLIPAHIWTPWFSLFGSKSGFNNISDCYGEYTKKILSVETGLSSDPLMNWRLSMLDDYTLISNSDCHSPYVYRIGRECNVFTWDRISYDNLYNTLRTRKGFEHTIEVDPGYGKYYFDGHRKCGVCLKPKESMKMNNECPECGKKLTIGVLHRVEQLADREEGYKPKKRIPFKYHIPLIEIISKILGYGVKTKKVNNYYNNLIKKYDNEFNIMFNIDTKELDNKLLAHTINELRNNNLKISPGYDGVYGEPVIEKQQSSLSCF